MENLYNRIEALCAERHITVTELCRQAGVPRSALSDYKYGRIKKIGIDKLTKIAAYFGVPVDTLLGGERTEAPVVSDEDIKFALFNGAGDITDEMFEEVKRFAQFVREREHERNHQKVDEDRKKP